MMLLIARTPMPTLEPVLNEWIVRIHFLSILRWYSMRLRLFHLPMMLLMSLILRLICRMMLMVMIMMRFSVVTVALLGHNWGHNLITPIFTVVVLLNSIVVVAF